MDHRWHHTTVDTIVNLLGIGLVAESGSLYVPDEAVDTYKATYHWSNFGTILPLSQAPAALKAEYETLRRRLNSADIGGNGVSNAAEIAKTIQAALNQK